MCSLRQPPTRKTHKLPGGSPKNTQNSEGLSRAPHTQNTQTSGRTFCNRSLLTHARSLLTHARSLLTHARSLLTHARSLLTHARPLLTHARSLLTHAYLRLLLGCAQSAEAYSETQLLVPEGLTQRRRIHASCEEEDTCMSYEEEDTCMSRIHACHMRRRIHACHMRRRIHACHMRRRIHACRGYMHVI